METPDRTTSIFQIRVSRWIRQTKPPQITSIFLNRGIGRVTYRDGCARPNHVNFSKRGVERVEYWHAGITSLIDSIVDTSCVEYPDWWMTTPSVLILRHLWIFSLLTAFVFFETIYWFVPNKKMSLKTTWCGSLVAAVTMELFIILFPLYARNFMGNYAG